MSLHRGLTRRATLSLGAGALALAALPARAAFAPQPGAWRTFEVTTRVEIPREGKAVRLWVPVPAVDEAGWMRPGESRLETDAADAAPGEADGARFIQAAWPAGQGTATLEVVSTVETRDRATDFGTSSDVPPLAAAERAHWTAPTDLIPTDGIVAETAAGIVAGIAGDEARARAIYDWVVESTERNPETRGCGLGDIASMLAMGDLTGKCADLNALFVGLARAAGLPARDVYGLRVAPSAFGYRSLGAGSSDVTKAQHCRAEVWLDTQGWVPADPADVRKVVLEETEGELPLSDPRVVDARAGLFGAWEGNWIGWNFAHDVKLPGSESGPVPFLMYPMAEVGGVLKDELDPARFAYTITAREVV